MVEGRRLKPPYRVPSMAEVAAIPWNGLTAVSTFSGCGGSSLGYRMAGFKILYANEFIPAARAVYEANAAPGTFVDARDIREVSAEDVLAKAGRAKGDIDLFDGSPPCASFSTAGKREKGWGKEKAYSGTTQRVDDLFFEYIRLVEGVQPRVFVAENVAGLVTGTAKGYFLEILAGLKAAGYVVACKVLDASWLGVPQKRRRAIFIGVRADLGLQPVFPSPQPFQYSVRDAIPWVLEPDDGSRAVEPDSFLRDCVRRQWELIVPDGRGSRKYLSLVRPTINGPCNTVTALAGSPAASVAHPLLPRKFSVAEVKRLCAFPDDFKLSGTYAQQIERMGRAVPPVMMAAIARAVEEGVLRKCHATK